MGRSGAPGTGGRVWGLGAALSRAAQVASAQVRLTRTHGVASRRIVRPLNVGGGVLEGFDRSHGEVRRFSLHRITSAAVVHD